MSDTLDPPQKPLHSRILRAVHLLRLDRSPANPHSWRHGDREAYSGSACLGYLKLTDLRRKLYPSTSLSKLPHTTTPGKEVRHRKVVAGATTDPVGADTHGLRSRCRPRLVRSGHGGVDPRMMRSRSRPCTLPRPLWTVSPRDRWTSRCGRRWSTGVRCRRPLSATAPFKSNGA